MDILVGKSHHYFDRIGVAVLDLTAELVVGDRILILDTPPRSSSRSAPWRSTIIKSSRPPRHGRSLAGRRPRARRDKVYKVVES